MKKILILLAVICCCGCSDIETKVTATDDITRIKVYKNDVGCRIYSVEIEGHIYLIYSGDYKGGIIHAEHCPCKMK
jgi:hypothetical protein